MWNSNTKTDLIIEVWEKLDCESVGTSEIEAIETALADVYGKTAVDSPMKIARVLADEGAELRHSEIMELYARRASEAPYEAALRGVNCDNLQNALATIRTLEKLRKKYEASADQEALRKLRALAMRHKSLALEIADRNNHDNEIRKLNSEIAGWLTIWLQTPEVFAHWVSLRRRSQDFKDAFGGDE